MKWVLIQKNPSKQPTKGTYKDWKSLLAQESSNQCAYCAIHENAMGGIRVFHVEHYRPKSKFPQHKNDYMNLLYACPICNTFKGDDWPNEPKEDNSAESYPNPSIIDYNTLFDIDMQSGLIEGKYTSAKYIQEKLFLNRPQLITERRYKYLIAKGQEEISLTKSVITQILGNPENEETCRKFMDLWERFDRLVQKLNEIPHYKMEDVTKKS